MGDLIYKIVTRGQWHDAQAAGLFSGAPIDHADGYIHFSSAHQLRETAGRHFGGQEDLLLVTVDAAKLDDALKWETSRGGDLFPHLYATLSFDAVTAVTPLPLDTSGEHVFGEEIPR